MEIVNIVTSGSLNQRMNLQFLSDSLDVFDYDPESYHGGYLKLSKYTATTYSSGKYIVPGVKSIDDIKDISADIRYAFEGIVDIGSMSEPEIRNIVAMTSVDGDLDLIGLFSYLVNVLGEGEVGYEPESFPGLIWKTELGTANIYRSGKIVLLGTNSLVALTELNEYVLSMLEQSNTLF